uniref:Uncharacterized protein n=1 Tax=Picea sitchensis TaxID=3332 RepID=A9NQM3_PICSI|nr:unknown [Picea sitchensis]
MLDMAVELVCRKARLSTGGITIFTTFCLFPYVKSTDGLLNQRNIGLE